MAPARARGTAVGAALATALVLAGCAPAPLTTASGLPGDTGSTPTGTTATSPTSPTSPTSSRGTTPAPVVTTLPLPTGPTAGTPPGSTPPGAVATPTRTTATVRPADPTGVLVDTDGHVVTAFATRDAGIVCAVADGPQVRCDVDGATWKAPPAPADCHGDWAGSITLSSRGAALGCATDTVLADAAPGGAGTWWAQLPAARTVSRADGRSEVTLATDATVAAGSGTSALTCRSDGSSVTCAMGRAGFTLSLKAYALR